VVPRRFEGWDKLEETIVPLLKDEARLEEMHTQSLKFRDEVCGEEAPGRFLALAIKESTVRQ
jgi:hypothetical protein